MLGRIGLFNVVVAFAALLSSVTAEISSGDSILPQGAGPIYDKFVAGSPQKQAAASLKKPQKKVPSTPASVTPQPKLTPAKKKKPGMDTNQLSENMIKAAVGVGIGVLAVPLIQSGTGGPKPIPPPPKVQAIAAPPVKKIKKVEPQGATISNEVFNLVKNIVGVGVLSLPAGVAAFGSAPSAIIPAIGLIAIIGILSAYGFAIIGKVCAYTGAKSLREAWAKSIGDDSSWIPAWTTTSKTFLACLAFSMVLADTFSSLLDCSRDSALIGVTLLVLLPLCLKKNLKSLAPFSLAGVLGMAYTAVAMTLRFLDGSYEMPVSKDIEITGLLANIPKHLRPAFGKRGMEAVLSPNSLILVCMLSTAFMCHFNAPKFYLELENNTLPRFNTVAASGFGISIFLMGFITLVGFLTFGRNCDGLVLNNYAPGDVLMDGSRIAVAISLIFSYPLAFTGLRDGIMDLTGIPVANRTGQKSNTITVAVLIILTLLASQISDLSFVLAFGGATLGNALTYVYPALMYRAVNRKQNRGETGGVAFASLSAVLGVVMGAIGAKMALSSLSE